MRQKASERLKEAVEKKREEKNQKNKKELEELEQIVEISKVDYQLAKQQIEQYYSKQQSA